MNRKRQMDGQAATTVFENSGSVRNFPGFESFAPYTGKPEPTWLQRRLLEAGVIMADSRTTKPPGFYVNWTTLTSLIVVVSAIVGLWYFTWQTASEAGYQRGKAEIEKQQLLKRIEEAERGAAEAKKLHEDSVKDKK